MGTLCHVPTCCFATLSRRTETPSNPLTKITDIKAVATMVHAVGGLVLVDSTYVIATMVGGVLVLVVRGWLCWSGIIAFAYSQTKHLVGLASEVSLGSK